MAVDLDKANMAVRATRVDRLRDGATVQLPANQPAPTTAPAAHKGTHAGRRNGQGSAPGGDPPVICGQAAGCGQSLGGAPETIRSGSLTPGTADGAARIEFVEFDPLVIAWQLNHAFMRGLAFCQFRYVLQKPA